MNKLFEISNLLLIIIVYKVKVGIAILINLINSSKIHENK